MSVLSHFVFAKERTVVGPRNPPKPVPNLFKKGYNALSEAEQAVVAKKLTKLNTRDKSKLPSFLAIDDGAVAVRWAADEVTDAEVYTIMVDKRIINNDVEGKKEMQSIRDKLLKKGRLLYLQVYAPSMKVVAQDCTNLRQAH